MNEVTLSLDALVASGSVVEDSDVRHVRKTDALDEQTRYAIIQAGLSGSFGEKVQATLRSRIELGEKPAAEVGVQIRIKF